MDSWNPDQLKKMQAGGNGKLNNFLKTYGVDKYMDITDKYNSKAAEFYREVIRAEVEGRSYTPPPPSQVPPPTSGGSMRSAAPTMSTSRNASAKNLDDWGDWGDNKPASNGSKFSTGSEYTRSQLEASATGKESFFARKIAENATKPDHLPPSQGGKYVGFGSSPAPQPRAGAGAGGVEDLSVAFSKGLTTLTHAAEAAAGALKQGTQNVQRSLQEKQVGEVVSQNAKVVGEKAAEVAKTGWTGLKSLYASVASTVEQAAKQHGYNVDLGAKSVAQTLEQNRFRQQMPVSGGGRSHGGYDQIGEDDDDHHHDYSSYSSQQHPNTSGQQGGSNLRSGQSAGNIAKGNNGGSAFAGFDGGDDDGWGNWGGSKGGLAHKSQSTPALVNQASSQSASRARAASISKAAVDEEEEWGKW